MDGQRYFTCRPHHGCFVTWDALLPVTLNINNNDNNDNNMDSNSDNDSDDSNDEDENDNDADNNNSNSSNNVNSYSGVSRRYSLSSAYFRKEQSKRR